MSYLKREIRVVLIFPDRLIRLKNPFPANNPPQNACTLYWVANVIPESLMDIWLKHCWLSTALAKFFKTQKAFPTASDRKCLMLF